MRKSICSRVLSSFLTFWTHRNSVLYAIWFWGLLQDCSLSINYIGNTAYWFCCPAAIRSCIFCAWPCLNFYLFMRSFTNCSWIWSSRRSSWSFFRPYPTVWSQYLTQRCVYSSGFSYKGYTVSSVPFGSWFANFTMCP